MCIVYQFKLRKDHLKFAAMIFSKILIFNHWSCTLYNLSFWHQAYISQKLTRVASFLGEIGIFKMLHINRLQMYFKEV